MSKIKTGVSLPKIFRIRESPFASSSTRSTFNNNYQLLNNSDFADDFDSELKSSIMQNNQIGFVCDRWFRIANVGDGSVVEIVGNRLVCRPPSSDPGKVDFQTFQCNVRESGHYEISSKYQSDEATRVVWDFLPHRGALIQKKQTKSAKGNQNWASEHVPGMQSTYFLLTAPEGSHCLKNMGIEEQLMVVPKTADIVGNRFAHWRLELLQPRLDYGSSCAQLSAATSSTLTITSTTVPFSTTPTTTPLFIPPTVTSLTITTPTIPSTITNPSMIPSTTTSSPPTLPTSTTTLPTVIPSTATPLAITAPTTTPLAITAPTTTPLVITAPTTTPLVITAPTTTPLAITSPTTTPLAITSPTTIPSITTPTTTAS